MLLFEPNGNFINDFVDLEAVVGSERPEGFQGVLRELVLLEKKLDDVGASLDKLKVSLPGIEDDTEDPVGLHPLDQEERGETLVVEHSDVFDDGVEVSDTLDAALKEEGFQAHQDNLKLEDFSLFFTFFLFL